MRQRHRYYAVIVLLAGTLLGLVSVLGADQKKASADCVIMPVGSSSVRVSAPASWHFRPYRALPDGAASVVLVHEGSAASVTITVEPANGLLDLHRLQATLEETLRADKQFHVTRASLTEVCGIPAATVAGTLLEDGTDLQARIWVLAASEHLWELSLTFPALPQVKPDEVIKQLIENMRIRPDDQQQWAKLSTDQQALLAYRADQESQQRARQEPEPASENQSDAIIRDLDSCLRKAAVGTSLDEDNKLVNAGENFPADTAQLVVLLQLIDAPANTKVTVQFFHGDRLLLQRLLLVSGSRKFAVTIYPRYTESFQPGKYRCQVKVNDQVAWELPIHIGE